MTTTATRWTEGPWRLVLTVRKGDTFRGLRESDIVAAEGCFLSLSQSHTADEADANARLIAAAPELVALLGRFVDAFGGGRWPEPTISKDTTFLDARALLT